MTAAYPIHIFIKAIQMTDNQVIKLSELKSHCQNCSLYELCLPMGLETGDLDSLDKVIKRRQSVNKNNYLYRIGELLKSIYAIRSGSLKHI